MKFVTYVFALTLTTGAFAQAAAKATKPAEGHDKEHQHVSGTVDHSHDDTHHKPHDHKAHHPEHDEKAQPKKK